MPLPLTVTRPCLVLVKMHLELKIDSINFKCIYCTHAMHHISSSQSNEKCAVSRDQVRWSSTASFISWTSNPTILGCGSMSSGHPRTDTAIEGVFHSCDLALRGNLRTYHSGTGGGERTYSSSSLAWGPWHQWIHHWLKLLLHCEAGRVS